MASRQRIRRRGGLIPRLIFAFAIALAVLEVGLRFVMGNGAQGWVVQAAASQEVCWQLEPGQSTRYTGDAAPAPATQVRVNPLGARGASPQGGQRLQILVLGDGMVFGPGVEDDATLPAFLAEELSRRGIASDVLNLGVPGLSTPQAVATLEARAAKLHPDVAVLVVSPDDLDPGSEECPHRGVRRVEEGVSAGAARTQLTHLLSTRLYSLRALRLIQDAGWAAVLDARGPYGPGRRRMGTEIGPRTRASAAPLPSPTFASTRTTPEERWGDVPILMPMDSMMPVVVPEGRTEYVFSAAIQRFYDFGAAQGIEVAVVTLADKTTFSAVTRCPDCRPPQTLLRGLEGKRIDLGQTWSQLLRRPAESFQPGDGYPTELAYEALAAALGGELAAWEPLRERR